MTLRHITSIPFTQLFQLKELFQLRFMKKKKEGQRRYKYHVLGRNKSNIVQNHYDSNKLFFIKLTSYLLCLVKAFFSRQSVFL